MTADANSNHYDNSTATTHEGDVESVTLTAGATEVKIPAGADVVRIQVTPGETIELPFGQNGMLARLDDGNGNLAVKVGDLTVILLGYTAATGEAPVTLLDASGAAVDVASVIAATDPSIEIATAAGAAAGDQAAGVDNNGGVFSPFDPDNGIGGLDAVGGLDPTALNYNLIQRQAIEIEENDDVVTTDAPAARFVVNEDDLERSEEFAAKEFEPYPSHVLDGLDYYLGGEVFVGWAGPHDQGNDPLDTHDHEDGSQNNPPLDDVTPGGIDQDREPLTVTVTIEANFGGSVPGHLSFSSNGTAPILQQLAALKLTSHGEEIKYAVLPGMPDNNPDPAIDNSHGETLVAYIEHTYGQGQDSWHEAAVIFTVALREFEATDALSSFNIDFSLYGVIDNVAGTADAVGDIADALDFDVPFFTVDGNGVTAPAADSPLPLTIVDDQPKFGWLMHDEVGGDGEGQGSQYLPVALVPSDTSIVHDESDGEQDPEDVTNQEAAWQVGKALTAAGWENVQPIGSARTWLDVEFGADGAAGNWDSDTNQYVGNKEAGKTVFKGDGDAYSSAFQFYVGDADAPITEGKTNWTITHEGEILTVFAQQISDGVIKGYALDGEDVIPVFVLSINPGYGEVILTQLHQVNHGDPSDGNEATPPLQIYAPDQAPTTLIFQDDFNDLSGWTTITGGNAQIVTDPQTTAQPNPSGAALLVSNGANVGDIEAFFGFTPGSGKLAAIADDGNPLNDYDADNDGTPDHEIPTNGSAIKQVVNVTAGDEMTVRFNFLENENEGGEGGDGNPDYQDFAFIVIGDEVIRLANVGEAGIPHEVKAGTFTWSEESGYLTFHFNFAATGPVQIGFGVMNEDDDGVDAGLLIDQILITHGNAGSSVIVRATDYDGDTTDAPLEVTIRDDVPFANDDQIVAGNFNQPAEGNLLANDDVGADVDGKILTVTLGGTTFEIGETGMTFYVTALGSVTAPDLAVASLSVGPDGSYALKQLVNLEGELPAFSFGYGMVDADGDPSSAQVLVTLKHYTAPSFEDETALLDEDGIPGKGADDDPVAAANHGDDLGGHQVGGQPDPATESIFRNTLGNAFSWGGDVGEITFTFTDAQLANIVLLDGTVLTLTNVSGNGSGHVIVWAGEPNNSEKVLELHVVDNATAVYEVQLFQPLQHPGHDNPSVPGQQTFYEDNIDVPVTVTATNVAGAPAHTLTISIDDDFIKQWGWAPEGNSESYNSNSYQWVDEDFLVNGNQDQNALGNPNYGVNGDDPELNVSPSTVISTNVATGHLSATFGADGGADKPYSLAILTTGMQFGADYWGLQDHLQTTLGSNLKVFSSTADKLVVTDSSNVPVMTLTLDQKTGAYSYTLHQPLEHHGANTEDNIYLRFGIAFTDGDGDAVTDYIGFVIDDDAPEGATTWANIALDVDEGGSKSDSFAIADLFVAPKIGADGWAVMSYSFTGANGQPLAAGGVATSYVDAQTGQGIKLVQIDASHIEARTTGTDEVVFKLTMSFGAVAIDWLRSVKDPDGGTLQLDLPVHVAQTLTDGDGDTTVVVSHATTITVTDDAPDAVDDGIFDIKMLGSFSGTNLLANDSPGADNPAQVSSVKFGNTDYPLIGNSVDIVLPEGTLTVYRNGTWTFNQPNNVPVPKGYDFTYTLTDADGSSDTASFSVALRTNLPLQAVNDRVILSDADPVNVPMAWLTRNDSDDHKESVAATFVQNHGPDAVGFNFFSSIQIDVVNPQGMTPNINPPVIPDAIIDVQMFDGGGQPAQSSILLDYVLNPDFTPGQILNGSIFGEIIIGNTAPDTINGNDGNDILYGGRDTMQTPDIAVVDMLDGGGGDDWLMHRTGDFLLGGVGFDTVRFDKSPTVNFDLDHSGADFVGRIHAIEAFDLRTAAGPVTFGNHDDADNGLSAQDVIDMTESDDTLYILGHGDGAANPGTDDKVYLDGAWTQGGQINIVDPTGATGDHLTFIKYTSGAATLYIQNTIDVE
jgi:hypothetical protein